jgi:hypothetical protein
MQRGELEAWRVRVISIVAVQTVLEIYEDGVRQGDKYSEGDGEEVEERAGAGMISPSWPWWSASGLYRRYVLASFVCYLLYAGVVGRCSSHDDCIRLVMFTGRKSVSDVVAHQRPSSRMRQMLPATTSNL